MPCSRLSPGCRKNEHSPWGQEEEDGGVLSGRQSWGFDFVLQNYRSHHLLTFTTLFWLSWGFPSTPTGSRITQYCLLLSVVTFTTSNTSSATEGMCASLSARVTNHSSPVRRSRPPASLKGRRARTCSAFWGDERKTSKKSWTWKSLKAVRTETHP